MPVRALLTMICFASICAAAAAQTADRSALLARLVAALPELEAPSPPGDTQSGAALRARLVSAHPDRVSEIDATLSRMSACEDEESGRVARRLLTTAADTHLTDDEIDALISFYEGPDYPRLHAIVHQLRESPELTPPEEQEWAQRTMSRPELVKFGQIVIHVGRVSAHSPEFRDIIRQCGDMALAELRASGLVEQSAKSPRSRPD